MAIHDPAYLARARELCTQYDVHLIADEIMTGFGRTGTLFACEQAGIAPDFLCLSKGLTGGYLPLSVVLTSDAVYAAFYDDDVARGFLHSHSYTGNALACRAALAVLDLFRDEDVIATNRGRCREAHRAGAAARAHAKVSRFRHLGMIWAFEVDSRARRLRAVVLHRRPGARAAAAADRPHALLDAAVLPDRRRDDAARRAHAGDRRMRMTATWLRAHLRVRRVAADDCRDSRLAAAGGARLHRPAHSADCRHRLRAGARRPAAGVSRRPRRNR